MASRGGTEVDTFAIDIVGCGSLRSQGRRDYSPAPLRIRRDREQRALRDRCRQRGLLAHVERGGCKLIDDSNQSRRRPLSFFAYGLGDVQGWTAPPTHSGLLDALDCPDPSATAPARSVTNTPLQALAMLNNATILRAADAFAARVERQANDTAARVTLAYRLAYGRAPSADELQAARRAVEENGLSVLTRALFNSNEFLFVE